MPSSLDELTSEMRAEPPLGRLQYWLLFFAKRCTALAKAVQLGEAPEWTGWRVGLKEAKAALKDAAPLLDGAHIAPADAPSTRLRETLNALASVDGLYALAKRKGKEPDRLPENWAHLVSQLEDWARRIGAMPSDGVLTVTPPVTSPTILEYFGLPESLVVRVRKHSAQYASAPPFHRGLMEFHFLLGADREFLSIARAHSIDSSKPDPCVFASNVVHALQRNRDRLIAMLEPSERADPASRLARAIDAAARLLDALTSVPFAKVLTPSGSLHAGPWVQCLSELERARLDVLGLSFIPSAADGETKPKEGEEDPLNGVDRDAGTDTQPWPDPISNAALARKCGYSDAHHMSQLIREALTAAGKAVPTPSPGVPVSWSHVQLRAAYPKLSQNKLKKSLEVAGLGKPERTRKNQKP